MFGFGEEDSFFSINYVYSIVENYGWYLLIGGIVLLVIYHKTLKAWIEKYREYRFEREYSAKYHKNPDVFAAHVNAQQQWAEKMQEKYNQQSVQYQEKLKEKEEKKKQDILEKHRAESGGHVLGAASDVDKKHFNPRTDYNPLMGAGNSSSYRPQRRSPCGGGGCGR